MSDPREAVEVIVREALRLERERVRQRIEALPSRTSDPADAVVEANFRRDVLEALDGGDE